MSNIVESFNKINNFLSKLKILDDNESVRDTSPCVVCLGILQNQVLADFIQKMISQIEDFKNDCSTVSFNLTLPTVIQIRERAIQYYLTTHFSSNLWDDKIKVQNIKEVFKWFISPKIKCVMNKNLEISNILSPFSIDVHISYSEDQEECSQLLNNYDQLTRVTDFKPKSNRSNISKKTIDSLTSAITDEQFVKCYTVPPSVPTSFVNIDKLICKHDSIFVGGCYQKLSRKISQTPWVVDGELKVTTSVQDIICCHLMDFTKAEHTKFLSSGREDVDVRMLLSGRPFAIELVNPRYTKHLQENLFDLRNKINAQTEKVKISNDLKVLTKTNLQKLKEGEYSKSKTYRALCICKKNFDIESLNSILKTKQNLEIVQNTPVRVLHRRAVSARKRVIYELRARLPTVQEIERYKKSTNCNFNDCTLIIYDFKTQAGTYVKEFVHGDFGRTNPSLSSILDTEIDIISLDVTHISLEWP
ncbi:hypothetical protein TSAR_001637 [Trichomalopsis sarcophagae]|uniref:tRNA pseudouridine(55) synthase n=1 Tax=Trichomalopsis sarcophagae TaxID=543379 RepID=A0A232EYN6_9HYME|nr:hypothetical protein TSAR_001637 [Trichomalopsis sarcophagae]